MRTSDAKYGGTVADGSEARNKTADQVFIGYRDSTSGSTALRSGV